jgi:hypothetical protein
MPIVIQLQNISNALLKRKVQSKLSDIRFLQRSLTKIMPAEDKSLYVWQILGSETEEGYVYTSHVFSEEQVIASRESQ